MRLEAGVQLRIRPVCTSSAIALLRPIFGGFCYLPTAGQRSSPTRTVCNGFSITFCTLLLILFGQNTGIIYFGSLYMSSGLTMFGDIMIHLFFTIRMR